MWLGLPAWQLWSKRLYLGEVLSMKDLFIDCFWAMIFSVSVTILSVVTSVAILGGLGYVAWIIIR